MDSKIKYIEAENFMSLGNVRIEFDDTNIVGLCGYNDSGKSAMTRLLEIMFYNAYSTDQAKFIKDGAEFWRGEIGFDDGVVLRRYKFLDGKSCWEFLKNGKLVYTNKLANGTYAALATNPDIFTKYLGVIEDEYTSEQLNVRRNTDKLFLINTTGGDNYKILNSVLQSDLLAEASKQLNDDKNNLVNDLNTKKTAKDVLSSQLSMTKAAPKSMIDELNKLVEDATDMGSKLARIDGVVQAKYTVEHTNVMPEVNSIDTERLQLLETIAKSYNKCNKSVVSDVEKIDTTRLELLETIAKARKELNISIYEELMPINTGEKLVDIKNLCVLYNKYYAANVDVHNITVELEKDKQQLCTLSAKYNFKICKHCGSIVE